MIMISNEVEIRLGFFFCLLMILALLELYVPRRSLNYDKKTRWIRNLSLVVINNFSTRIIIAFTATSVALYAEKQAIGLFNQVNISDYAKIIISLILLDLAIYIQHLLFHHIPIFWKLHKIHHIDQDIDVSTAVRFHPIEILLSTLIKCAIILLLGVPVIAVIIFEIILNAGAMFSHANIKMPLIIDKYLRLFIVTPDMHRVHHSTIIKETNSNFGFNLSIWDRIFNTYTDQPSKGHKEMEIGLIEYQNVNKTTLVDLIVIPFKKV